MSGALVQVLLDGGSTHNFIQPRVAKFLNLEIEATPTSFVVVGSGQRLRCEGMVRNVPLSIQGCDLNLEFFVLSFHGSDLVLGISWLAILGPVIKDYRARYFEFSLDGVRYSWHGEASIDVQPAQLQSIRRLAEVKGISSYYQLELVQENERVIPVYPEDLMAVLHRFKAVFCKPHGLPPLSPQDHAIHLQHQADPVNVKPYRYPYFQKQVMEQLVSDMLKEGVIQASTSPFFVSDLTGKKGRDMAFMCGLSGTQCHHNAI